MTKMLIINIDLFKNNKNKVNIFQFDYVTQFRVLTEITFTPSTPKIVWTHTYLRNPQQQGKYNFQNRLASYGALLTFNFQNILESYGVLLTFS